MVKISYAYKKQQQKNTFLERENKKYISRILLFQSEIIGRCELQTL